MASTHDIPLCLTLSASLDFYVIFVQMKADPPVLETGPMPFMQGERQLETIVSV
jgi:hypothetical protein